jgi:hypothetical protein
VLLGGRNNYNSKKLCAFRDGRYKPILLNGGKYACKVALQNDIKCGGAKVPEKHRKISRKISLETALGLPDKRPSCWKKVVQWFTTGCLL